MPEIPVNSPLGYVGILALAFGFFLILAGLEIVNIEKIIVARGPKTWGFGIFLTVMGIGFLLPDIVRSLPQSATPSPTAAVAASTPSATLTLPTNLPITDTPELPDDTPTSQPSTLTPTPKPTDTPKPTNTVKPPTATPSFITKLTIPSDTNLGVTYDIQQTGFYTFQYSDSAVAAWGPLDSDAARWHTKVKCFPGTKVKWIGSAQNEDATLFVLGSGMYASAQAAVKATKGAKVTTRLNTGEQITCIVEDGISDFSDNSGEVILDVFLSP